MPSRSSKRRRGGSKSKSKGRHRGSKDGGGGGGNFLSKWWRNRGTRGGKGGGSTEDETSSVSSSETGSAAEENTDRHSRARAVSRSARRLGDEDEASSVSSASEGSDGGGEGRGPPSEPSESGGEDRKASRGFFQDDNDHGDDDSRSGGDEDDGDDDDRTRTRGRDGGGRVRGRGGIRGGGNEGSGSRGNRARGRDCGGKSSDDDCECGKPDCGKCHAKVCCDDQSSCRLNWASPFDSESFYSSDGSSHSGRGGGRDNCRCSRCCPRWCCTSWSCSTLLLTIAIALVSTAIVWTSATSGLAIPGTICRDLHCVHDWDLRHHQDKTRALFVGAVLYAVLFFLLWACLRRRGWIALWGLGIAIVALVVWAIFLSYGYGEPVPPAEGHFYDAFHWASVESSLHLRYGSATHEPSKGWLIALLIILWFVLIWWSIRCYGKGRRC